MRPAVADAGREWSRKRHAARPRAVRACGARARARRCSDRPDRPDRLASCTASPRRRPGSPNSWRSRCASGGRRPAACSRRSCAQAANVPCAPRNVIGMPGDQRRSAAVVRHARVGGSAEGDDRDRPLRQCSRSRSPPAGRTRRAPRRRTRRPRGRRPSGPSRRPSTRRRRTRDAGSTQARVPTCATSAARERHVVDVGDAAGPHVPARPGRPLEAVGKRHDHPFGIQRARGRASSPARWSPTRRCRGNRRPAARAAVPS